MTAELPKITEMDPVTAAMALRNFEHDAATYRHLVERRDTLLDRIQFGAVALNAASLLALLGALGGGGKAAVWLGFNAANALYSSVFFAAGLVAAGVAILHGHNRLTVESGDAFARMWAAHRWLARMEAKATSDNYAQMGAVGEEHAKLKLVGFRRPVLATALQFVSLGAWLAGISLPLASALLALPAHGVV